jgi:hypothetical protein
MAAILSTFTKEKFMISTIKTRKLAVVAALFAVVFLVARPAHAEMSAEELAKLAQNPVGNLISVPFQNNNQLSRWTAGSHAEHPEHPAGYSNPYHQRVEHHHPHHFTGDLSACPL